LREGRCGYTGVDDTARPAAAPRTPDLGSRDTAHGGELR
jgi:hypothetical protein